MPFRPDWEHVLTPVFDFLAGLDDVDPARIAVYGISQGGYWVARAIAFEHRYAAAITDPGVVDVSASWTSQLPKSLTKLLDEGQNEKFDKEMGFGMKFSPETERTWLFRARPYGTDRLRRDHQRGPRLQHGRRRRARSRTPLLITSPEGEQFWPGQAEQLASLTAGRLHHRALHRRGGRGRTLPAAGPHPHRSAHVRLAGRPDRLVVDHRQVRQVEGARRIRTSGGRRRPAGRRSGSERATMPGVRGVWHGNTVPGAVTQRPSHSRTFEPRQSGRCLVAGSPPPVATGRSLSRRQRARSNVRSTSCKNTLLSGLRRLLRDEEVAGSILSPRPPERPA